MKKSIITVLACAFSAGLVFSQVSDWDLSAIEEVDFDEQVTASEVTEETTSENQVSSETDSSEKNSLIQEADNTAAQIEEEDDRILPDPVIENSTLSEASDNKSDREGFIVIAPDMELPQGMFALAKGYFPGDSLEISVNNTSVKQNVLVIGTLDASSDYVLKLSYQAAQRLKVSPEDGVTAVIEERIKSTENRAKGKVELSFLNEKFEDFAAEEAAENEIPDSEEEKQLAEADEIPEVEAAPEIAAVTDAAGASDAAADENDLYSEIKALDQEEIPQQAPFVEETDASPAGPEEAPEKAVQVETAPVEAVKAVEAQKNIPDVQTAEETETTEKFEEIEKKSDKTEPVQNKKEDTTDYKKLVVSENRLKSGIYVQLAFLKDEENLNRFCQKYGRKYRLYLVPANNGFKVITGRFASDGYKTELGKIKKDFPDAFVKNLK